MSAVVSIEKVYPKVMEVLQRKLKNVKSLTKYTKYPERQIYSDEETIYKSDGSITHLKVTYKNLVLTGCYFDNSVKGMLCVEFKGGYHISINHQ